jgi:hypothetical protein
MSTKSARNTFHLDFLSVAKETFVDCEAKQVTIHDKGYQFSLNGPLVITNID